VLDPTYSGKAALGMVRGLKNMKKAHTSPQKTTAVFLHTGGMLGLMAKETQVAATFPSWAPSTH